MKKSLKILAMTMLLAAILVLSITGTVFAAGMQSGNGNQGEVCPYGGCDNEECPFCNNEDCEPKDYSYYYNYKHLSPGPHKPMNAEMEGAQTAGGNGNQGEVCPYGDCVQGECEPKAYAHNYNYEYETSGPNGAPNCWQNGKTVE